MKAGLFLADKKNVTSVYGLLVLVLILCMSSWQAGCAGLAGAGSNPPPSGGDTTPPTVSLTAPTSGATVSGTTTVSASASDNVGVASVQCQLDGANLGSLLTVAPYTYSWNTTTVSNGSHTLRAVAKDAAGNSATSAAVTVTVSNTPADTTPPTVSISAPANGATESGTTTVSANASDNVGVASVQFQLDSANVGSLLTASPYTYSWNTTTTSNGSHTLRAIAKDAAGNSRTSATVTVTVSNTPTDTTPPTVSISAPVNGATVSGTTTVSANASDNVGVASVQFQLDSANVGSLLTASPYTYSWNTTTASNGSHTLRAIAKDAAGNSTTSAAVTVTVSNTPADTQAPTVPTGLAATAVSSSEIDLTWTASTDNVGVAGYNVYRDGSQVGTSTTTSYADAGLSASTSYSYTVAAYDAAGNTSQPSTSASATTLASSGGGIPSTLGWYQIPNTQISPLCPGYSDIQGSGGCSAVVYAWGSGLADTKRNRMFIWGGGHVDYYGNETYALDLNANPISMLRLTDASHGSGISNLSSCPDVYSDGQPASRHGYASFEYLPTQDRYFTHGAGLPPCGNFGDGMWWFDPNSVSWTEKNPPSPKPDPANNGSEPMHAYDSVTDTIYDLEANTGIFWQYNPAANTWKQVASLSSSTCNQLDASAVIDPVRRIYICIGGGEFQKISLNSPYTVTSLSGSNCGSLASSNAPGFAFDSSQNLFVGWNGGNTVYTYNPDTDSCTSQSFSGGPGAQQPEGTYGRFRYFPSLGVFILINDVSQNAYSLRVTASQSALQNFQSRCTQTGVIVCQGFDSASVFTAATYQNTGFYYETDCPTWPTPCVLQDTSVSFSGGSSARWDIYGNTGENAEGNWFQQFPQTFGPNSTFYVQYAFRADPNWVSIDWTQTGTPGDNTAPKLSIFHNHVSTCAQEEITFHDHNSWTTPTGYSDCGAYHFSTALDGVTYTESTPYLLQQGFTAPAPFTGEDCQWTSTTPSGTCFRIQPSTWYTFYFKIHVGGWGQANSSIEAWFAPQGQGMKKFINVTGFTLNQDSGVNGFDALTLTQFMTGKQASVAHATAHVWYDELIVSTNPIPPPTGPTP